MTINIGEASRRQFLLGSISGPSSAWLALRSPAILAAQEHAQRAEHRAAPHNFSSSLLKKLSKLKLWPHRSSRGRHTGRAEARVIYFIDRVLVTFDRDKQPSYTRGLTDLDRERKRSFRA